MPQDSPSIEDLARAVFAERAGMYVASAAHTDPQVLGRLVELARPEPAWRVLDVATGAGHTAFAFAPHVAEVVAMDLTPEMLAQAESLAQQRGIANVRFAVADIHHLPFDDPLYDDQVYELVTCRRAAHHFGDIEGALLEMVRVLKPGGLLLIDDRSVPEDNFVDPVMNRLDWLHDESHVRQYRPGEWWAMLAKAGCDVLAVEPYVKHRPVRSLTDGVSPDKVALIQTILQSLPPEERPKFGLEEKEGELYSNHWYVMVLGRRVAGLGW